MKIKSKFNKRSEIKNLTALKRLEKYSTYDECQELTKNEIYTVQGIDFREDTPCYFIYPDPSLNFPTPFDSVMFDIIDPRFSKYWQLSIYTFLDGTTQSGVFFDKWAQQPELYDLLLDDDENAIEIFEKYKKILDEEFV